MEYSNDYEVRLATLGKLGGDTGKTYASVYEIDLAILALTGQGGGGGISDAPSDGKTYGRKNGAWTNAVSSSNVNAILKLSQEQYDALAVKDENTLYIIVE